MSSQGLVGRLVAFVGLGAASLSSMAAAPPAGASVEQDAQRQVVQMLDRMPLLFVPEQVSPDGGMGFAVRGSEASVWLSATGLSYRLAPGSGKDPETGAGSWVVALDFVGATPRAPVGEDPLPTKVSYFKGPRDQWRTGLPSYESVRYREPWPGVDVVVSGTGGELESTFVVRPGADPGQIRLAYRGAEAVRLDADGSLVVDTPLGSITEQAPVAYQELNGRRVEVAAAFELASGSAPGSQAYRFRLGKYDPSRELEVDPVTLIYCGYIGGAVWDGGLAVAVDAAGNIYVTGLTDSNDAFPVSVGPDLTYNGDVDAFVAKINSMGTAVDYCGYIGGSRYDVGRGIAIDSAGNAYVSGETSSAEATFPVTVGPDLTFNGDHDAFVAHVNADGTHLDYCGYIGGAGYDSGNAIAVDGAGNVYVSGVAQSDEFTFPVHVGPDISFNGHVDAFVARVNATGTSLDYCGYVGGSSEDWGTGIAVDIAGNAYVCGGTSSPEATFPVTVGPDLTFNGEYDAFVAKINSTGNALDYCGYIGGAELDRGLGIAIDGAGNTYVTGVTWSRETTFPVTAGPDLTYNGYEDAFVAKVDSTGTALDYCGYIGGAGYDSGNAIAVDAAGSAYVAGYTTSTEATFPVTVGPDLTSNGGYDAFISRVNCTGTAHDYCGYIGGAVGDEGFAIAVDIAGDAYVSGETSSTEATFPVTVGPDLTSNGDFDAFVAKVGGFLFRGGFESGDTSTWSSSVDDLADQFNELVLSRGISGEYADCQFDSQTGIYSYLGQSFHESDGGLGGTPVVTVIDLYWKNEFLASTVPPYNLEDPDHDGVQSFLDADALNPDVW